MGGAIHELGARGMRLLKPVEFIGEMTMVRLRHWIPPRIWHEPAVKQVETSQILDLEIPREKASQFDRCEQVKAERHMPTVAKVDFTVVLDVIMSQAADVLYRFHEGRWRAADRTHGRYEMSRRHARDLCRDIRQPFNGQMTERAVQAKGDIDRAIGFRQPVRKVCDVECEADAGEAGKISSRQAGALDLCLRNVESARSDAVEPERVGAHDQSPQPCAGPAAGIKKPDRSRAGSPQVHQFCFQHGPDAPIRIGMHSVEDKWLRRITIGIRDVVVASLIVDVGDVVRRITIDGQGGTPDPGRTGRA
ncbi:hypothetical protein [Bradyrhizobium sp. Ai1a-2]|uniref:hypothetical protein n=1 Tax=Bradyrhizobium sp. Ai1a-2 TaxID=196490 RepID=UPI001FCA99AD|nr:hypothetical protein [Bradyrhizobium sp. Ai1a-2]